jgi:hypothetical protein
MKMEESMQQQPTAAGHNSHAAIGSQSTDGENPSLNLDAASRQTMDLAAELQQMVLSMQEFLKELGIEGDAEPATMNQQYFQGIKNQLSGLDIDACLSRVEWDEINAEITRISTELEEKTKKCEAIQRAYLAIKKIEEDHRKQGRMVESVDLVNKGLMIQMVLNALKGAKTQLAAVEKQRDEHGKLDGSIWSGLATMGEASSEIIEIRLLTQVQAIKLFLLQQRDFSDLAKKNPEAFEWYVRSLVLRDYLYRHRAVLQDKTMRVFVSSDLAADIYEGNYEAMMGCCQIAQQRYGQLWAKGVEFDPALTTYSDKIYIHSGRDIETLIKTEVGLYSTALYLLHQPQAFEPSTSLSLFDPYQYNSETITPEQLSKENSPEINPTVLSRLQNDAYQELESASKAWLLRSNYSLAENKNAILTVAKLIKFYLISHRLSLHFYARTEQREFLRGEIKTHQANLNSIKWEVANELSAMQRRATEWGVGAQKISSQGSSLPVLSYTIMESIKNFFEQYFFERSISKTPLSLLEATTLQKLLCERIQEYYITSSHNRKVSCMRELQRIITRLGLIDNTFEAPGVSKEMIFSEEGITFFTELCYRTGGPDISDLLNMLDKLKEELENDFLLSIPEKAVRVAIFNKLMATLKNAQKNKQNVTSLLMTAMPVSPTDEGFMEIGQAVPTAYLPGLLFNCIFSGTEGNVKITQDSKTVIGACYAALLGKVIEENTRKFYLQNRIPSIFKLILEAVIPLVFLIKATQLVTDTAAQEAWVADLLSIVGVQGFFRSLTNTPIDLFVFNAGIKMLGAVTLIALYCILSVTLPLWDAGISLGVSLVGLPWLYRRWSTPCEDEVNSLAIARQPNSYWEDITANGKVLLEESLRQWKLLLSLTILAVLFRNTSIEVVGDALSQNMKQLLEIDLKLLELTGLTVIGVIGFYHFFGKAIIPQAVNAIVPAETQTKAKEYWHAGVDSVSEYVSNVSQCVSGLFHRCFKRPSTAEAAPLLGVRSHN